MRAIPSSSRIYAQFHQTQQTSDSLSHICRLSARLHTSATTAKCSRWSL